MKILFEISDELFLSLAERAKKKCLTIEELILASLSESTESTESADQRQDLDDEEIAAKVSQMGAFAYNTFDQDDAPFTVQMLFEEQFGRGVWQLLTDSSRKKIGRRFKTAVDEVLAKPKNSEYEIEMVGKTPANAAQYQVRLQKRNRMVSLTAPEGLLGALAARSSTTKEINSSR